MKKVVLLLASMASAMLLASAVTLVVPREQARAAFPGINGKISFLSDRADGNEIYTISFSGGKWGNAKRLTFNTKSDKTPAFSPNGKKIVWERGENLYEMDADGTSQHRIPNTFHSNFEIGRYGSYGGNPAFSASGRKIIFDMDKNIYTINPDGTGLTRITNAAPGGTCQVTPTFVHPVWSPVSREIAFSYLCGKADRELHMMPLSDLSNKQNLDDTSRLSPEGADVYRPDWSPDGTQIVYECYDPCGGSGGDYSSNPEIYKVNANGSGNMPLTDHPADESYPVFSPGGGKIAFSSDRGGDEELYIKNADPTSKPEQLTFNQARDVEPDWQPIIR